MESPKQFDAVGRGTPYQGKPTLPMFSLAAADEPPVLIREP